MEVVVLRDYETELENEMCNIYSTLQNFCQIDVVWVEGRSTRILRTKYIDVYFKTWTEARRDKSLFKRFDFIFGVDPAVIEVASKDVDSSLLYKFCFDDPVQTIVAMETMLRQEEERKYKMIVDDILKRRRWL